MKHIFVVNPFAGKASSRTQIEAYLRATSYDWEIYETTGPKDATRFVRERAAATPEEKLRFYACGGDGTINEVAEGVLGQKNASLGCYPCGSGNDYVKYYGGAKAFADIGALCDGREVLVDAMVTDRGEHSINVCNFGFDSHVVRVMEKYRHKKGCGGKIAYYIGILSALKHSMRNRADIYVDGEKVNDGTFLLCTIANGSHVGSSFCCAPRSSNDDGYMEFCMVKPLSVLRFISLILLYVRGTHLDSQRCKDLMIYRRCKKVEVFAPEGFIYLIDGEPIEAEHFWVEMQEGALPFVIPKDARPVFPRTAGTPVQNRQTIGG